MFYFIFLDFDNSNFISNQNLSSSPTNNSIEYNEKSSHKPKAGFFGKVGSFLSKTTTEIGSKIKDMKIGEKMDKMESYLDKKANDVIVNKI